MYQLNWSFICCLFSKCRIHRIKIIEFWQLIWKFKKSSKLSLMFLKLPLSSPFSFLFFKSLTLFMLKRERESGVRKATGSYRTYSSLVKMQPWFLTLMWNTCLLAELPLWCLGLQWKTCSLGRTIWSDLIFLCSDLSLLSLNLFYEFK